MQKPVEKKTMAHQRHDYVRRCTHTNGNIMVFPVIFLTEPDRRRKTKEIIVNSYSWNENEIKDMSKVDVRNRE